MITFNEIWQANQLQLKNFIATKIPEQEVPDLLQLVSIALFKNIENGTPIKNYKNWLFQVSRNKMADYYKKKSKMQQTETGFSFATLDEYQPCICDVIEQIIETVLPPKYSVPLILSDIYKVPQQEIANRLEMTYANTKTIIQRARKKMKVAFENNVDFTYNQKGEVVGGVLKSTNYLPAGLIEQIKNLQIEH